MDSQKVIPAGVRIIVILNYVGIAFQVVAALGLFFEVQLITNLILKVIPSLQSFNSETISFFGIFFVLGAIVEYFVTKRLSLGKNDARIFIVVATAWGAASGIFSITQMNAFQWIGFLINIAIAAYLWFDKSVRLAFAGKPV